MNRTHLISNRRSYSSEDELLSAVSALKKQNARLIYMFANDEHRLGIGQYKMYYIFCLEGGRQFEVLEFILARGESYPSISHEFPHVEDSEWEVADYFGLTPQNRKITAGMYLHNGYGDVYPFRKEFSNQDLIHELDAALSETRRSNVLAAQQDPASDSIWITGEHKGVNEPETITFQLEPGPDGNIIKDIDFFLGHQARLIEYLAQDNYFLVNLPELAEQFNLPSACSYAAACSRAVEKLSGIKPRVPLAAEIVREILTRLQVIGNFINYVDSLARCLFLSRNKLSHLSELYSRLLDLNIAISGNPYLSGLIRVGGVRLPMGLDTHLILKTLNTVVDEFVNLAFRLAYDDNFRERCIGKGTLSQQDALNTASTGILLTSTEANLDPRRCQPYGIYAHPVAQKLLEHAEEKVGKSSPLPRKKDGDVYARFLEAAFEVQLSAEIIKNLLGILETLSRDELVFYQEIDASSPNPYHKSIGSDYAFTGENLVWLLSDKLGRCNRFVFCSASFRNIPAVRLCLNGQVEENLPLIMMSIPFVRSEIGK